MRVVETLLVARESSWNSLPALETLLVKTLAADPQLPGGQQIRSWGIRPLTEPREFPEAVRHQSATLNAVTYWADSTFVLLCRGSAALRGASVDDDELTNAFTELLVRCIRDYRPRRVLAAEPGRLVRTYLGAAQLNVALLDHGVEEFWASPLQVPDVQRQPKSFMVQFNSWCIQAAVERETIVSRTSLGRHYGADLGKWTYSPAALPLGWTLADPRSRLVVLDRQAVPVIQQIVDLLAQPISSSQMAKELQALGVCTPGSGGSWQVRPGEAPDIARPSWTRRRLGSFLDVWATGRLPRALKVSTVGTHLDNVPMVLDGRGDKRLHSVYRLPLPEAGFASADSLALAKAMTAESSPRAAVLPGQTLPLLLACDAAGSRVLRSGSGRVRGIDQQVYVVARHGAVDGTAPAGPSAVLWPGELHEAVASAAVSALRSGGVLHLVDGEQALSALTGSARDQGLERRQAALALQSATSDRDRAGSNFLLADAGLQPVLLAELQRLQTEVDARQRHVHALSRADEGTEREIVATAGELVVQVLAELGRVAGGLPGPVAYSVGQVIRDLHVSVGLDLCQFEYWLRLPVDGGAGDFGPIRGSVRNHIGQQSLTPEEQVERQVLRAEQWMNRDTTFTALSGSQGSQGEEQRRRIAGVLRQKGASNDGALRMTRLPVLAARRVLWAGLQGLPTPADVDHAFAAYVQAAYASPSRRGTHWLHKQREAEALVAYVREHDGSVHRGDLRRWADLTGFNLAAQVRGSDGVLQGPAAYQCFNRQCGKPNCRQCGSYNLMPCPHCGGVADVVLRVPEVPRGLLCSTCRRMPTEGSPQFPAEYLGWTSDSYALWLESVVPDAAATRTRLTQTTQQEQIRRRCRAVGLQPAPAGVVGRRLEDLLRRRERAAASVSLDLALSGVVITDGRGLQEHWQARAAAVGLPMPGSDAQRLHVLAAEWALHLLMWNAEATHAVDEPVVLALQAGTASSWRERAARADVHVPRRGPLSLEQRRAVWLGERGLDLGGVRDAARRMADEAAGRLAGAPAPEGRSGTD